jgi:hypothetical protein
VVSTKCIDSWALEFVSTKAGDYHEIKILVTLGKLGRIAFWLK